MFLHLHNPNNGHAEGEFIQSDSPRHSHDLESSSACSTPYASAPSSPGCGSPSPTTVIPGRCFFSAPTSPVHDLLTSPTRFPAEQQRPVASTSFEFEFEFSEIGDVAVRFMSSADELFLNGQIRPMKLSSHMERTHISGRLVDNEGDAGGESVGRGRDRGRYLQRKARSLSPLRSSVSQWPDDRVVDVGVQKESLPEDEDTAPERETTFSSSRSSSSGRNSKKWIFLKEFLQRSKSEGRNNGKEKFWSSMVFSPSKEKKLSGNSNSSPEKEKKKKKTKQRRNITAEKHPTNRTEKRRVPVSAHEQHYTAKRAQAAEMKKRTYLPYKKGGLLGGLGLSSKGLSGLNGLLGQ